MYYYTSGNTQIRVAFTAAMMKLKGAKIPPTSCSRSSCRTRASVIRASRAIRGCLRDVADPAEPAPPDVPVETHAYGSIARGEQPVPPASPLPTPCSVATRDEPRALRPRHLEGVRSGAGARDVSVDCRAGEIHALVGENGSGKSTLLGIASGFVAPRRGHVEIGGRSGGAALPPRPGGSASAWRTRPTRTSSTSRSPRTSTSPRPEPAAGYGRMEDWAAEKLTEFELDVR